MDDLAILYQILKVKFDLQVTFIFILGKHRFT